MDTDAPPTFEAAASAAARAAAAAAALPPAASLADALRALTGADSGAGGPRACGYVFKEVRGGWWRR